MKYENTHLWIHTVLFYYTENLPDGVKKGLEQFLSGNFGNVLVGDLGKKFFEPTTDDDSLDAVIHTNVEKLLTDAGSQETSVDRWVNSLHAG